MLVQRAVDPTKLEFLSQVYKRKDEAHLLDSAQKYLTTLHKVSDILSRASSVEALFDSIVQAILDVTGGDRAAVLMRNNETAAVDMVTRSHQGRQGRRRSEVVAHGRQRRAREGHLGVHRRCACGRAIRRRRIDRPAAHSIGDVRADAHDRRDSRRALRRQPDGARVQRSGARTARRGRQPGRHRAAPRQADAGSRDAVPRRHEGDRLDHRRQGRLHAQAFRARRRVRRPPGAPSRLRRRQPAPSSNCQDCCTTSARSACPMRSSTSRAS